MTPTLDKVSVWTKITKNGLDFRIYDNYPYLQNGIILNAKDTKPVIRYCKNYKDFSLLMISHEKDTKKINKFFGETAKKIKSFNGKLQVTEFYYE